MNFFANLNQLCCLPKSLYIVFGLINRAFTRSIMDRALFDFYGALHLELPESELRLWPHIEGGFDKVKSDQIVRTPLKVWQQMILFAAETEAPINNYSTASAEILRASLPSLSAYMGRTMEEEEAFLEMKASSQEFCDTVWCREESRHGPTLVALATQISGKVVGQDMTYDAQEPGDFSNKADVYQHIIARNCSEWHANGLYLYLQAHSRGATAKWLDNVCADETRHLTVFSAAYTYLYGQRFSKRIKDMLKFSIELRSAHKTQNSHGKSIVMAMNVSAVLELLIIHFFIEQKIRKYLKTIPLMTLRKIFEIQPMPSKRPLGLMTKEKQSDVKRVKSRELEARKNLLHWTKKMRQNAVNKKQYKQENAKIITNILKQEFNFFQSASDRSNFESKLRTLKLSKKLNCLLTDLYRDYIIMSQGLTSSVKDMAMEFDSVEKGFNVRTLKDQNGYEYACFCKGVTKNQVLHQIKLGALDIKEIQKNTQANTGCGRCLTTLQELLNSAKT